MNIKINYSKLDFTKIDFYFLSIFLSHFCGGISLIVYKKKVRSAGFDSSSYILYYSPFKKRKLY